MPQKTKLTNIYITPFMLYCFKKIFRNNPEFMRAMGEYIDN